MTRWSIRNGQQPLRAAPSMSVVDGDERGGARPSERDHVGATCGAWRRWTGAVFELLAHAAERGRRAPAIRGRLIGAARRRRRRCATSCTRPPRPRRSPSPSARRHRSSRSARCGTPTSTTSSSSPPTSTPTSTGRGRPARRTARMPARADRRRTVPRAPSPSLELSSRSTARAAGRWIARREELEVADDAARTTTPERCEVLGRPLHVEQAARDAVGPAGRRGRPGRPSTRRCAVEHRLAREEAADRRRRRGRRPARRRPTPRRCGPSRARAAARRRRGSSAVIQPPGRPGSAHASTTVLEGGVDPHLVAARTTPQRAADHAARRAGGPRGDRATTTPSGRRAPSGIGKRPWR